MSDNILIDAILNGLFWAVIVYAVLRMLRAMAAHYVDLHIQELQIQIQDVETHYRKVRVEQHGDTMYLWDAVTDQFIMQGRTAQDFIDQTPDDITLLLVHHDPKVDQRFKQMMMATEKEAKTT